MVAMAGQDISLHWFRKGLRLTDNGALLAGLKRNPNAWFPIYILDRWHRNEKNVGNTRFRFIIESLQQLDKDLKGCGTKCGLLVFEGEPEVLLPKLMTAFKATTLSFDDYEENEPHSRKVDELVKRLAKQQGVSILCEPSHCLYSPKAYEKIGKNGQYPKSFSQLQKLFSQLGPVPKPLPIVRLLPYNGDVLTLAENQLPERKDISDLCTAYPNRFPRELSRAKFPGGEREGLMRLQMLVKERASWTLKFNKPSTPPLSLEPSTTGLSPYLTHGCISLRTFWDAIRECNKNREPPPIQTTLSGQLMWRELWQIIGRHTPNFGQMKGNPLCKQIPWDDNEELFEAWKHGKTGFPMIDAIMNQLRTEGWIHHLARHRVACFLTRGDLWQSWEKGAQVFDEYLIDADWSLNNSNWMWLSCSAFFHQYFRCYSPVSKDLDKDGAYIRKYIKELENMPNKYIHEPWKAPLSVQKAAGCIIGKDYPRPIVKDHSLTSKENMARMKSAYANQALKREHDAVVANSQNTKRTKISL